MVTSPSPLRRAVAGAVVAGTVAGLTALAAPPAAAAGEPRSRYVVQFVGSADAAEESRGVERAGGRVTGVLRNVFPGAVADLTAGQAAALRRHGRVQSVEADQVYRRVATQDSATWGLDRADQRALPLSGAFSYGVTGKGVTAYVVDTGVLSSHAELAGRTAPGHTVVADGRGTEDCNGHGTHVAGTTGGTAYGVAKAVTVVPVRVLGCDGSGSTSGIVSALDWVVAHHPAGVPAVANLSLGGGASITLDAAVDRVVADGVTVVVAAGNSGVDACTTSPARAARALTVGATDRTDAKASWSNSGSCLDLFAPGVGITSAWHTGSTATNTISGTSMAAPHVAGAVAALLEARPGLTPDGVTTALLGATTPGVVTAAGTGSPNRLLHADPALVPPGTPTATAPSAPTSVTAKALSAGAAVSWVPGADGGSPLTAQAVQVYTYAKNGRASLAGTVPVSGSATSVTVSGLRRGTSYAFTVTATNAVGTSPASATSAKVTAL